MIHQLFLVLFLLPLIVAQGVDPGAGTFVCLPCARSNCYLSNTNNAVSVPGLGRMTCGQLQQGAVDRVFFPDECGAIQTVTLATSDPCQCKLDTGGDCPDPGFTNNQVCNLCGGSNKRIGDPHMIIKSGILAGSECIRAFDDNAFGAFSGTNCAPASESVQRWCSCVSPGDVVKQCIQQEDSSYPCDPDDPTDECCDGECKFRSSESEYVCTNKAAQVPPPNYTPPQSNPNNSVPNQVPATTPQPIPGTPPGSGFFNSPPGVHECHPNYGCGSSAMTCAFIGGGYASYKCISASASDKDSYSVSVSGGGGGAGGQAKANGQ